MVGGHHAQQLAGFVIVYAYGALAAAQRLVGRRLQAAVQRQIHPPASTGGAGEEVIAQKLFSEILERGGGDVARLVAHGVEGGAAESAVFTVSAGCGVIENNAVAVDDLPQRRQAVFKSAQIAGEGRPASAQRHIAHAVRGQPRQKQQEQYINKECALLYLFHLRFSFLKISSTGMSGRSAKKPSCLALGRGAALFLGAGVTERRAKLAFWRVSAALR